MSRHFCFHSIDSCFLTFVFLKKRVIFFPRVFSTQGISCHNSPFQKRKDVLFASKTFAIDYVVETFGYIRSIIGILTATIVVGKATYFIK